MKQTSMFRYILRLAGTLLLITSVVAALLAWVNSITEERIADTKAQKTINAIAAVLPDAENAEKLDGFPDDTGLITAVYQSSGGYAIEVVPTGFGGDITMMVGVGKDGNVLGVSVVSHTETAGLGAVAGAKTAKGQAFRDQFIGMTGTLAVSKDGGTVDSISGATITSRAVTQGVNAALSCAAALNAG